MALNEAAIEARLEAAAAACSRAGAQLTKQRRAVLALVLRAPGPLTAYQLLDRLKETQKRAMPPTIYRALDFLTAHELIHKIERLSAFIPCVEAGHEGHDHAAQFLICRNCGTVAELEDAAITAALRAAATRRGFAPGSAIVEIEGLCGSCAEGGSLKVPRDLV